MPVPPILETPRLILRPLEMADAKSYYPHLNDWKIARYFPVSFPWPYPLDGAEQFIAKALASENKAYIWGITLKDQPQEVIGIMEMRPHKEDGHRGFWIGSAYHGQGLMTEVIEVTSDFWFDVLKQPILRLANARGNMASTRLKEKYGARLVRLEDDAVYHDSQFTQREIWELTAEDWYNYRQKNG